MKNKLLSLTLSIIMIAASVIPCFASTRLERPVIDEVDVGKNSIKIDWQYIYGSMEYDIYRSTSPSKNYKYICTTEESWFRDYEVKKGTRYYYKVKAISWDGDSDSRMSKWRSGKIKISATKHNSSSNSSTSSSSRYTTSVTTQSYTVYITNTGAKYHRYGCRYLRQSCIPISLNDAKFYGYSACSVCW